MSPHIIIGDERSRGTLGRDNRVLVEGMLRIVRTGAPWRDVREVFGSWNSVFRRLSRGSRCHATIITTAIGNARCGKGSEELRSPLGGYLPDARPGTVYGTVCTARTIRQAAIASIPTSCCSIHTPGR